MRLGYVLLIFTIFLASCEDFKHLKDHDPSLQMPKQDYENALTGQDEYKAVPNVIKRFKKQSRKTTIPAEFHHKVSISITDAVPLKDVFLELARQAKVGISVSPKVTGGLFFQAQDQSFINIVKEICESANLRYKISGTIIKIEPDEPYSETYNIQNLSHSRENSNRISMATDVFTSMEGQSNAIDNGSATVLSGESRTDFWEELSDNLDTMLNDENASYTVHKQAGLITVNGKQKLHNIIGEYLKTLSNNTKTQVLIEAKIVEVHLNEAFKSGINWQSISGDFKLQGALGNIVVPGKFLDAAVPDKNVFTVGGSGKTLQGLVSILNNFGTVRTLSSPRITVMNNQSAVLKVATNFVFFKIYYTRELGGDSNNSRQRDLERASSQIQTVPIGLVMMVHPTIDLETGKVTMSIRPTISRIDEEKEDPAVAILSQQTKVSKVPQIRVREMDSVLQVDSGDIVVMGGLMEERSDNQSMGIPGAQEIPVFGNLFSAKDDSRNITELVIFIKATIVEDNNEIGQADDNLYQNFTKDPRPFVLTKN